MLDFKAASSKSNSLWT